MNIEIIIYAQLVVLLAGTGYAWYQFAQVVQNQCDTCSVGLHKSPFKSKCFVGAVFFTTALVLHIAVMMLVV
jgi:hypothetical protein